MAKKQFIELANVEDFYFDECLLIGIDTHLCGTQLCVELQSKLDLDFYRNLGNEAEVHFKSGTDSGLGIPGTLFENIATEQSVWFPLYEYTAPFTDSSCISIFENHQNGFYLVPECKQFNFIILLKNEDFQLQNKSFHHWLSQIPSLKKSQILSIEDLGQSKQNLIM